MMELIKSIIVKDECVLVFGQYQFYFEKLWFRIKEIDFKVINLVLVISLRDMFVMLEKFKLGIGGNVMFFNIDNDISVGSNFIVVNYIIFVNFYFYFNKYYQVIMVCQVKGRCFWYGQMKIVYVYYFMMVYMDEDWFFCEYQVDNLVIKRYFDNVNGGENGVIVSKYCFNVLG